MIPAAKHPAFEAWFARHAERRIESTFGRVLVSGLGDVRALSRTRPILFVLNHTAWWDALVVLWLTARVLRTDGYALMDLANLTKLPFFSRVGAFGVDLESPRDGARAVRHAAKLLDRPGRVVFVFPQGAERSPFAPLELRAGAAYIARAAKGAAIVPIGLRYVFGAGERPDLFVAIGGPVGRGEDIASSVAQQKMGIERALGAVDHVLATRVTPADAGFETLSAHRPGFFAELATTILAKLFPARAEVGRGRKELSASEQEVAPAPPDRA